MQKKSEVAETSFLPSPYRPDTLGTVVFYHKIKIIKMSVDIRCA
jgi:hypothetical protein